MRALSLASVLLSLAIAAVGGASASAQGYRLERIASGLQQPVYVDQAPGDPANVIYYMTRVTTGGANASNGTHGSLWRYDMNTRVSTEVLNLSHRNLTLDLGPQGFAFHPDFNNPGTAGHQKIYVSSAVTAPFGNPPVNYVEEYALSGPNGTVPVNGGTGLPVVNRTLLEYENVFSDNNHVIDWIGFDPRAYSAPIGSAERNYLFISAGDGSNGRDADQRPEQKANIEQGKLLRIDIDPDKPDFYPGDPQKNFAIPDSNPIPLWNSTHDEDEQLIGTTRDYVFPNESISYTPALPEIYFTGTRNTFRMSLDRATGDIWSGDVGEVGREEINFLPADPYDGSQVPYDFGYPQREGTNFGANRSAGDTTIQWNLSGGGVAIADSVNPIQEGPHAGLNGGSTSGEDEIRSTGRSAYIGGYVYRGPVEELQGKYFYSDFVQGNIFSLDFDASTPVEDFSGTNFNQVEVQPGINAASLGTREVVLNRNLNSLWHTIMLDPQDSAYSPALGGGFGIGRVVSFGEDNDGNLYIVDMGGVRGDAGFGNDYPGGATGQIFRITPFLDVRLVVDRATGALTIANETGGDVDVQSYQIISPNGLINTGNFSTTITGNLDATGTGDVDDNDAWEIVSNTSSLFHEGSTGDAGTLGAGFSFELSDADGWERGFIEDLSLRLNFEDGTYALGQVEFVGDPFGRSDLNFNGTVDLDDWRIFVDNHLTDLSGLSPVEQYLRGDLNGDGFNNFDDFRIFQIDYVAIHGEGSLADLGFVPEPNSLALAATGIAAAYCCRRRRKESLV